MNVHWNQGAPDCAHDPSPPLQVHAYNARTFVLRESLCRTYEAPFIYLLIGATKALLIDSGDVADPSVVPLAETVIRLLPQQGGTRLPLLLVHTHRHLDHRAGDEQFTRLPDVQVVGFDIDSIRRFYHFRDSPNGLARLELGDRTVDAISSPGHNETEVSFYDRSTGLLFTGDFLMPARLLVEDRSAYVESAERVAAFVRERPVTFVLGGHVEKNVTGATFPWQSTYHPDEHVLELTKDDVRALPAAVRSFNGLYSERGQFLMENPTRIAGAVAVLLVGVLALVAWVAVRQIRRRARTRDFARDSQADSGGRGRSDGQARSPTELVGNARGA
jgi:glyoxylase-like metal-dependent hydrolase (beta-lactamase superfamily II)